MNRTLCHTIYVVGALLTLCISLNSHIQAGNTLPIPWNDESWTLFPALNLMEHARFHAPELNPDRVIFCYPLHDAFYAATWRLHGGWLPHVRAISWFWTATSYALLVAWMFRVPFRFLFLAIVSWGYLSAPMVVAGNMARPEAFILALSSGALLANEKQRPWLGVSISLLTAVVHPVGVILCGLLLPAWAVQIYCKRLLPRIVETVILTGAMLAVGFYLYVILRHWGDYWNWFDSTYSEPMTQDPASFLLSGWVRLFLAPSVLLLFFSIWRESRLIAPSLLLLGVCMIPAVRTQMWYDVYKLYGIILMVPIAGRMIGDRIHARVASFRAAWTTPLTTFCLAILFLPFLHFCYRHGWLEGPRGYPFDMTWGWGMIMEDRDVPYFRSHDEARLREALETDFADLYGRLLILPEGNFFLLEKAPEGFSFYQPVRTPVLPDAVILHRSRYKPDWVARAHLGWLERNRFLSAATLFERDETEAWDLWLPPSCPLSISSGSSK